MTVVIDNTGFNVNYWARFDEQGFIEHGIQQRFFKEKPEETRRELLKIAYQLVQLDIARATAKT